MSFSEYTRIFQNKNFRGLFFAQFTSQLGSTIGVISFTFYLLERFSNQPAYATLTEMMYAMPMLFVFFLTGVFADKFDRQKVALHSDLICAGLSFFLLLFIHFDLLPFVYGTIFLRSAVGKFFPPAQSSLIHGILPREDYPVAMGMNQVLMSIFIIAGNGAGALVYWTIGIKGAIVIDTVSYMISAYIIKSLVIGQEARLPNGRARINEINVRAIISDFVTGIQYVLQRRTVYMLLIGIAFLGIINGGLTVMNIFIMKYKLTPENYEETQILLSFVSGTSVLISSFCAVYLSKKVAYYKLIIASFLLPGLVFILEAKVSEVYQFIILHFLFAFTVPLFNVSFSGWLGQLVDRRMMGRVQGLLTPVSLLMMTLTQGFIAVTFPAYISVEVIFYIVGAASLLVGSYFILVLPNLAKKDDMLLEVGA